MLQRNDNRVKINILLCLYLITVLIIFKNDLKLLFLPDPEKNIVYTHSFNETVLNENSENMVISEGFITGHQGLLLAQGSSGKTVFSFTKQPKQGCLMRIWFYGDKGTQRPNEVKISVDEGKTYQSVTGSGNYIGSVFDLNPYVKGCNNFQIMFEAKNHSQFTSKVFDKIELVISGGELARPALPNITKILGFLLLAVLIFCYANKSNFTRTEMSTLVLLLLIILLAAYFRWNELTRIAGTILDRDVVGYNKYASKMCLFSDNGFYSAQFAQREPLYILLVKLCFKFFGNSETHVRLISFIFSLVVICLTYKIGKEWFNSAVGLIAAFILSIHPYLISLSARGFRAEWFTTLLLLFIYYGYVKDTMGPRLRVLTTGFLIGSILLTRSESFFMVFSVMILTPLFVKKKWNYKMVLITLLIGVALLTPHLYSIYKIHGTPFHTVNIYTRFYVNQEFMGKPGFPTRQEIGEKGMYTGTQITPFEYYFHLHTPWQFIKYNMLGFAKNHLKMPFHFATGKGTLGTVEYALGEFQAKMNGEQLLKSTRQLMGILKKHFWDYALAAALSVSFLVGLVLIIFSPYRILLLFMVFFQVQTSFVAYLGIDTRLTVHSYPLIALCCGYCIWWVSIDLRRRFKGTVVATTVSGN